MEGSTHHVVWDIISLAVIPIFLLPYGLAIVKKDRAYAVIAVGTIICEIIVKLTRKLPVVHPVQLRPSGAKNCSILNRGGSYEGRIGMPSGHVLLTSYVLVSLFLLSKPDEEPYFAVAATVGIIFMSMSRVIRTCHNVPQVIAGAMMGSIFAFVSVKYIIPLVSKDDEDNKEL